MNGKVGKARRWSVPESRANGFWSSCAYLLLLVRLLQSEQQWLPECPFPWLADP